MAKRKRDPRKGESKYRQVGPPCRTVITSVNPSANPRENGAMKQPLEAAGNIKKEEKSLMMTEGGVLEIHHTHDLWPGHLIRRSLNTAPDECSRLGTPSAAGLTQSPGTAPTDPGHYLLCNQLDLTGIIMTPV